MQISVDIESISNIRSFLDSVDYHAIYKMIKYEDYYVNPALFHTQINRINRLPDSLKLLFKMLVLSENVSKTEFCEYFGEEILDSLTILNIVGEENHEVISKGYSIISCFDLYLLVQTKCILPVTSSTSNEPTDIYIGNDSYRLGNLISSQKPAACVLDLCSGSGIQALISLKHADRAVAVELNENAAAAIKFNGLLNNMQNRLEVINNNLFDDINRNEVFDRITINPPFFPIPEKFVFPQCGNGGSDGMDIVRETMNRFSDYLDAHGDLLMVLEAIGDENSPFIIDELIRSIISKEINISIFYNNICSRDRMIEGFTNLIGFYNRNYEKNTIKEILRGHYSDLGVQNSFSTSVIIHKNGNGSPFGHVQEIRFYEGR